MINEAAQRLLEDLAFAAPEMHLFHIKRRMEEVAATTTEQLFNAPGVPVDTPMFLFKLADWLDGIDDEREFDGPREVQKSLRAWAVAIFDVEVQRMEHA